MNESFVTPPLTKMLYGWSKWGGGTKGIAREVLEEWNCQICGEKQLIDLPQYFFPLDSTMRDFIRICASCRSEIKKTGITNFVDLSREIASFKEKRRSKIVEVEICLQTHTQK